MGISTRVLGVILLMVGAGLVFWGYQMSGELGAQLTRSFSGSMSDSVTMRYGAGAASIVVGLFLVLKG